MAHNPEFSKSLVTVIGEERRQTDKGVMIHVAFPLPNGRDIWLPKSQVKYDKDDPERWHIPEWLAYKHDLL